MCFNNRAVTSLLVDGKEILVYFIWRLYDKSFGFVDIGN
jgi:hypothetical protein